MSCISFSDLGMICRHFNLNTSEVFELLSTPQRTLIARASVPSRSVTAVSDSGSEASSVAPAVPQPRGEKGKRHPSTRSLRR